MSIQLLKISTLTVASCLLVTLLSGCTTYTWEDGSKETIFGVPAEDERLTEEERRAQGVRYREPGEIPE
ncbi:hypothetical protein SAMN04487958_108204 [Vreelandella subterranea]|uniref:Uncharacterized protein n=1 Tax=Vreelandella subterranea TaxID=416874 RepID=A0A1H9VA02_9GAMM|nr:hypothetical protein [Halomonas subterranea]SES18083.1 hypothetical protein SAMN04487958_108204 [Halomonas subterranea]